MSFDNEEGSFAEKQRRNLVERSQRLDVENREQARYIKRLEAHILSTSGEQMLMKAALDRFPDAAEITLVIHRTLVYAPINVGEQATGDCHLAVTSYRTSRSFSGKDVSEIMSQLEPIPLPDPSTLVHKALR